MPRLDEFGLAAQFVTALYTATSGRPGQFARISNCAERAGIRRKADIQEAVRTAEAAGFIMLHVDEPLAMLTTQGRKAAQPRRGGRR